MTVSVKDIIARIPIYGQNPGNIQRDLLSHLTEVTSGKVVMVDASNPFIYNLEAACVTTAGTLEAMRLDANRLYPQQAVTWQDLYAHMSDSDYIDRFAIPSKTKITVGFDFSELKQKMVTDTKQNVNKVVIPRNSYVEVAGTAYSIQYPIEIRVMPSGGVQVFYQTDVLSPLQTLETNILNYQLLNNNGIYWLVIDIDVWQFRVNTTTYPVTRSAAFNTNVAFVDQFYYARVWYETAHGKWVEMITTHSDMVYDPTKPTALLQVVEQQLSVTVPVVYVTSGMVTTNVRVDIYTTKGNVQYDLGSYSNADFQFNFYAIDPADQTPYTAPFTSIRSFMFYSDSKTVGGQDAMTFDQLRERVMSNSVGQISLPITPAQIQNALQRKGYDIIRNVDNVTDRSYLATKKLPTPNSDKIFTPAASTITTLNVTVNQLQSHSTVKDNGDRMTVMPSSLFRLNNGQLSMMSDLEIAALNAQTPQIKAVTLNDGTYFYTPFYYVLDRTQSRLDWRPYQLDQPMALSRSLVTQNPTVGVLVNTANYIWVYTPDGYELHVYTLSDSNFKSLPDNQITVQLGFTPPGETDRAYMLGTLVATDPTTKERQYKFKIGTNWDVNKNDRLMLTSFNMYTLDPKTIPAGLTQDFDLFWTTTQPIGGTWVQSEVDTSMGSFQLPSGSYGITHENIRLKFGDSLQALWSQSRSTVTAAQYQTYTADVPATYVYDVWKTDANGSAVSFDAQGNPVTEKLHAAGDVVLDAQGKPVLLHKAGDVVLDPVTGLPTIANPNDILLQLDLFLLEGVYRFATDAAGTKYRNDLVNTVVSWLTADLADINKGLLEKTKIFFYPNSTMGNITIMFGNRQTAIITAGQTPTVRIYVRGNVYQNLKLRAELEKATIKILAQDLTARTYTKSTTIENLRTAYGSDVEDVEITGIAGSLNLSTLTVLDPVNRLSLRKRLVAAADNSLAVEEDVVIDWIRHEPTDFINT